MRRPAEGGGFVRLALFTFALVTAAGADEVVATFPVEEVYGVSHPQQVVEFDPGTAVDGRMSYVIGPDGNDAPSQVLSNGRVAVVASLPANTRRVWTLYRGRAPKPPSDPAVVTDRGSHWEITNGLTGVRVAKPDQDHRLAPIQGVRLRDGRWTALGPNYIYPPGTIGAVAPLLARAASVKVVEHGPVVVKLELNYAYSRPDLVYNVLLIPGGDGFYRSTITLQAGQPSILIEDDTDMDLQYVLDVYDPVKPDQGRYRGHVASRVEFGREPDGRQYRLAGTDRPEMDAVRELPYDIPAYSSYTTGIYGGYQLIKRISAWDRWARDTGWYWTIYNREGDANWPVVGAFAGRASLALGAHASGPGPFTMPAANGRGPRGGYSFQTNRRGADGRVFPRARVHWGLFMGRKGEDVIDALQVQNINRQMNVHGGINLNKVMRWQVQGWDAASTGGLYLTAEASRALRERVRTDEAYYRELYSAEPTARNLLDMWRDRTGVTAQRIAAETAAAAHRVLDALINGVGIHSVYYGYWQGGLEMSRRAPLIDELLRSGMLSGAESERMKRVAVLFGQLLWDDDFVPLFEGSGLPLGTQNMPEQQNQYRNQYALWMRQHPLMGTMAAGAESRLRDSIREQINEWGAQKGSPHYVGATMGPLLSMVQQLKVNGGTDLFRAEDRLRRFGEFYMQLLTPGEVRFGGSRKLVSIGDGSTESSELFGQTGTGLADVDTELSGRLMGAWRESGRMHSGFHATTVLKIDERLGSQSPQLGSAAFPGWFSVLRNGWGTTNETAVWMVNGNHYSDHRHQDMGTAVIYALKAPLSVDWGSLYSPQAGGAYMHNLVLPEGAIGRPWADDNAPLNTGTMVWRSGAVESLEVLKASSRMVGRMETGAGGVWLREIRNIHANEALPVIVIRDRFAGEDIAGPKVMTLNMMSEAEVQTPRGALVPPLRLWEGQRQELPSVSEVLELEPGLHRFGFRGQWGVDWDLYTASGENQQAVVGNWAHGWHPGREQAEFAKANGRTFRERQNIFRLRGAEGFTVLLLPFRRGEEPAGLKAVREDGRIRISAEGREWTVDEAGHSYRADGIVAVTAYGESTFENLGVRISGGTAEVVVRGNRAVLTVHGPPGTRRIRLPEEGWRPETPAQIEDGDLVIEYNGSEPLSVPVERTP
jgi:hypothetical protein